MAPKRYLESVAPAYPVSLGRAFLPASSLPPATATAESGQGPLVDFDPRRFPLTSSYPSQFKPLTVYFIPPSYLLANRSAPVSPLAATLMDLPASVANKRLTVWLSPLDATLTKNRGGRRPTYSHRSPSRQVPLFPKWSAIATPSFLTPPFNFILSTVNLSRHSPPASHPPLAARIRAAAIQGVPHV